MVATLENQLEFPMSKSPLGPVSLRYVREAPSNGPQKPHNVCTLCVVRFKPRTTHILGYVAQSAILMAPSPPLTTQFLWFPSREIAQTEA